MLRLMLQEQADGIMTEEILDGDDYADWIRWASDAEENIQSMHVSTHNVPGPVLLQQHKPKHDSPVPMLLEIVQVEIGNFDCKPTEKFTSCSHLELGIRWKEICERIKIDTDLGKNGQQQL